MRYIVRNIRLEDKERMQNLLEHSFLLNLPKDSESLCEWIQISENSFNKTIDKKDRVFIFVLEDLKTKQLIACSQILSAYNNRNHPYFLMQESKAQESQNQESQAQKTLKLCRDPQGRHQVGGLLLLPSYRGTKDKLGFLIAAARYLYISTFSDEFSKEIEANLTGPFYKKEGIMYNAFWEEVGRKHYHIHYWDSLLKLFKEKAEFFNTLPKDLEVAFKDLSSKAQHSVENIYSETLPAYKNLLKLGFQYRNKHHFIDGAQYVSASQNEISLIKQSQKLSLKQKPNLSSPKTYLCTQMNSSGFFASFIEAEVYEDCFYIQKTCPYLDDTQKVVVSLIA